jgi:hypothetical protein
MQTQKLFMEALIRDVLKGHPVGDDPMVQEAALRLTAHLAVEVDVIKEVLRQRMIAARHPRNFVALMTNAPIGSVS